MIRLLRAATVSLALVPLAAAAQDEAAGEGPPPRPAKLMVLEGGRETIARDFYGRIRARETVDLAFQVGGQIVAFPVGEGSTLAEGEMIAELDLSPFERQLEQARVALDKAERDLERLETLGGGTVSQVQIQDARTQAELARIDLRQAEDQLADATLRAPFEALVARKSAATFQTVQAGTPVVRLHDMSELQVAIDVPEVLFRRASGGEPVEIYATFPERGTRYPLAIREYQAETADVGQTYRIALAFEEAPGDWVLPGASATVTAVMPVGEGAGLVLPETALVYDADREPQIFVFVPSEDDPDIGTVRVTAIGIEVRDDGRVVLTDGPEAGTEIVATGAAQLTDGQAVRRFTRVGE